MEREVKGLYFGLRRKIKPFLLVFLSLQFFWTFYCANFFDYTSAHDERVESRLAQTETSLLPSKDNQEAIKSQKGSFSGSDSDQDSGNMDSRTGNPQTGGDRRSAGEIGILDEDPLDPAIDDYIDNQDSDMDALGDLGILTNFTDLQATDSIYANFSEVSPGGSDITVSSSNTIINNYTYLIEDEPTSETALAVNDASDFSEGDTVLIIQMQNGTSSGTAGQFEFNTIASVVSNTINLRTGLANAYYSGTFDAATNSEVTQVVQVPVYKSLTVQAGGSITCPAWDGYTGGIIVFNVTTFVTVTGSIDADGCGFRGGLGITSSSAPEFAYTGESWNGKGSDSTDESPNNGGGGGGDNDLVGTGNCGASGGGGGYGTAGLDGDDSQEGQSAGHGGDVYGVANLDTLFMGSGGGGGGSDDNGVLPGADGGAGGGIVVISATTSISVTGTISSNGEDGTTAGDWTGAGGGGSGGPIWLRASTLTLGTDLITAIGGSGGIQGQGNDGGDGGDGRIRLDNTTLTGSTNPTAGYHGNPIIVAQGSYQFSHEVQFTSIAHFLPTEKLCIKTGSFGGSEDLNVTVWNGSAWRPIFSGLTASSWNNDTVAVNTTIFTIKFGGSTTSSDSIQDYWLIDAVLLHLNGTGTNETYVMNDSSNVDSSTDKGSIDSFSNMQDIAQDVATLAEDLEELTMWIFEDDASNGYNPTSSYESFEFWSSFTTNSSYSGLASKIGIYVFAAPGNSPEVKLGIYDDNNGFPNNLLAETVTTTIPQSVGWLDLDLSQDVSISPSTTYHLAHITNTAPTSQWRYSKTATPVSHFKTYGGWPDLDNPAGSTSTSSQYRYGAYRLGQTANDYQLDQEVQWTGIPYQLHGEYLCIQTGSMDAENLDVEIWNGSDWVNVISGLNANAWNNVSVHSYLNSTALTIRFVDSNQPPDDTQDSWEIDAVILHIWAGKLTKLSVPLLIYSGQMYNLSSVYPAPEVNFTDSFTIRVNYTAADSSTIPEGANPAVRISSTLTKVSQVLMTDHENGTFTITLSTMANATGEYSLSIIGTAANYQPQDDEHRVFMVKANPTELITYSYSNESIVDAVYYHPTQRHAFYLQWNDTNHNVGIDASTVEINSSKVIEAANGTLGGHSFEFLPNALGIDALHIIKITLFREGYESLIYTVTFDVQVTPTIWSSFGPMNGTAAYYDKVITLWMVWNDSPHTERISGGSVAHNGSVLVSSVQEVNGNYSLIWHLDYTSRLPLPQIWVLNVTLSQYGYESRSLLFEISLQKSPTAGVAEYSSGATIWLNYTDQYTFWVQWQDSDGAYGSSTPIWINDTDDPDLNDSFVTYLEEDSDPALGNYTFIFNENGMLLPGLYIIGITFANATHGDTLYELRLFVDYTPTGAGECSYANGSTVQVAYNDSLEFFIRWQDLNHSEWLMAVGYIERGDLELVSQLPNGNHSFRFNSPRNKAIGSYPYIIVLNKTGNYGYIAFAYHITFIVTENPSAITDWLSRPSNETVVTLGKTYDFWLQWTDLNHSTLIAGASVAIIGSGSLYIQELTHSEGTYYFRFEANQQAFFEANISLSLAGYKFASHSFNFTVLFLHTAIVDSSVGNATTINLHYTDIYQMWLVWNDTDNNEWMEDPAPEFSDVTHVNLVGAPSAGNHTFQFNATDLGFFAVTITFEVPGYEARHFVLNFQITSNPTAISESRHDPNTTVCIRYSDSHEFWLVWQDTYHSVVVNDTTAAITGSETTQLALIEPGNHTFRFTGLSVGSFEVTITLEATGYNPTSFRILFIVEANPTAFTDTSPSPDRVELIPFGSLYDFFILWEDTNHSLTIDGASSIINDTNFIAMSSASGGYYTFTFNASKLGPFGVNITLTKVGYESLSFFFTIVVMPSPTTIHSASIPYNATAWLYYGDNCTFWTCWQDVTTLEFITDNVPYSFGSGSAYIEFLDASPGNGNHTFKFAGSVIGKYFLTLTFGLDDPEHASTAIVLWFDVRPRPTENVVPEIAFPDSATVETIIVAQYAWEDNTSIPVSGASVLVYWNGMVCENNSFIEVSTGIYNVSVDTGEVPWGFHNLTLWFRKYGFINQTIGIDVTIIGLSVELELLVPQSLVRGQNYVLEACLYRNNGQFLLQTMGTPIVNQPILFLVAVVFDNSTKHEFNGIIITTAQGVATFVISHRETKNIMSVQEVKALYLGSGTYMGADSTVLSENIPMVESKPQAVPLAEQLWDFILQNLLYVIISSLILLALLAVSGYQVRSYQKTRKRHQVINRSLQEIRLLRMIIIRHKDGVTLFSKSIFGADGELAQAIAGMSAAISAFMEGISARQIEGTGDASSAGRTEFIRMEQKGLHMLQRNGVHIAVIVISEGPLGEFTEKNMRTLQLEIEQRFEEQFARFFTNEQIPQDQLEDLVNLYLYTGLLGVIQLNEPKLRLEEKLLTAEERQIVRELRAQKELVPDELLFIDSYIAHLRDRGIPTAVATQFLLKGYQTGVFETLSSESLT